MSKEVRFESGGGVQGGSDGEVGWNNQELMLADLTFPTGNTPPKKMWEMNKN